MLVYWEALQVSTDVEMKGVSGNSGISNSLICEAFYCFHNLLHTSTWELNHELSLVDFAGNMSI